jgi:hypothetical protein
MMFKILSAAALCAGLIAPPAWAQDAIATGKTIEYSIAGYTIQADFLSDKQLRWTYLKSPIASEVGKTAVEQIDQLGIRRDVILAAWTEQSGAQVVDVFDFGKRKVIANFVTPDGKRYQSVAPFTIVRP